MEKQIPKEEMKYKKKARSLFTLYVLCSVRFPVQLIYDSVIGEIAGETNYHITKHVSGV